MDSQLENSVHCVNHGSEKPEAFVCEHLVEGNKLGFYVDSDNTESQFPDAWCVDCERIRQQHGGWDDNSQALISIKLVCGDCYREIKERNIMSNEVQN